MQPFWPVRLWQRRKRPCKRAHVNDRRPVTKILVDRKRGPEQPCARQGPAILRPHIQPKEKEAEKEKDRRKRRPGCSVCDQRGTGATAALSGQDQDPRQMRQGSDKE